MTCLSRSHLLAQNERTRDELGALSALRKTKQKKRVEIYTREEEERKNRRKRKERRDSRMHQSRETRRFNVRVENSSWRTHTHTRFLSEGHHFFSLALLFLLFQERRKENQNMRFLLDRGERGEIYADVEPQGEALSVLSHRNLSSGWA